MCDLKDEGLFDYISTLKRFPSCDSSIGWFSEAAIEILRTRIVDTILHRVNELVKMAMDQVLQTTPPPSNPDLQSSPNFEWFFRYIELPDLVMSRRESDAILTEMSDRTAVKEVNCLICIKPKSKCFPAETDCEGQSSF